MKLNKCLRNVIGDEGFSLTELMVVLVIIGILVLLALPRFMTVTTRAKMTEAKLMLKQLHTLEQAYYYEHDAYSSDLETVGFEQAPLVTAGGTARYTITVEKADDRSYVALATSVVDFDKDGTFNVWEIDDKGIASQRVAD